MASSRNSAPADPVAVVHAAIAAALDRSCPADGVDRGGAVRRHRFDGAARCAGAACANPRHDRVRGSRQPRHFVARRPLGDVLRRAMRPARRRLGYAYPRPSPRARRQPRIHGTRGALSRVTGDGCRRDRACPSRRRPGRDRAVAASARRRPARFGGDAALSAWHACALASAARSHAGHARSVRARSAASRGSSTKATTTPITGATSCATRSHRRLTAHFPGFPATLARAAALQAEASELLDALAQDDAQGAVVAGHLDGARLGALSPPRARNLLRWFLHRHGLRSPSSARLADMLRQLVAVRADARTRIHHDGAEIGCHRGLIVVHVPTPATFAHAWHGEAEVHLPGGTLVFEPTRGSGMAAELLARQSGRVAPPRRRRASAD